MIDKTRIDLACGQNKREGFIGVDIVSAPGVDIVHDLNVYPWPFEDNSVDEINCSHYIEHIKHSDTLTDVKEILHTSSSFKEFKEKTLELSHQQDGMIKFMDEIYRILKVGGKAILTAPYVTHTRAYGDPTHTRYIHDMSFYYYNKEWRDTNKLDHYGIKSNFDMKFSYYIDESLLLKSEEVRNELFTTHWNSIKDIIANLVKI